MLKAYLCGYDQVFVDALEAKLNDATLKQEVKEERNFAYLSFEGHQSRLGHYYRHLYQLVRFVERSAPAESDVMEHMRTIRAQLSTHEQALLLLNSLTPMGGAWWTNKLIDRFFMVHNIPKEFFNGRTELGPSSLFDEHYFETVEANVKPPASLNIPFARETVKATQPWLDEKSRSADI